MQLQEKLLVGALAIAFVAVVLSLFRQDRGILALRIGVLCLAALHLWTSYQYLWFAIRMANAFSGGQSGSTAWLLYFPLLMTYYGVSVLTSFTRPLRRVWIVPLHFVLGPVVAALQFSGLPFTTMLSQRLLHLLCFVLLWLRLHEVRLGSPGGHSRVSRPETPPNE
jgi:hypothetical protein